MHPVLSAGTVVQPVFGGGEDVAVPDDNVERSADSGIRTVLNRLAVYFTKKRNNDSA